MLFRGVCFLSSFSLCLTLPTQFQVICFGALPCSSVTDFTCCWLLVVVVVVVVAGCFGAGCVWVCPFRLVPLCPPSSEPALLSSESP